MVSAGSGPNGHYVMFDGSINVGGDRNWRNNNPGNMNASPFTEAHGALGSDGRFAIFADMDTGMKALSVLLTSANYINLSIVAAMNRYAPPSENNTDAYTSFISSRVGVDPSTLMSDLTADQLAAFAQAIYHYEGGTAGTTYQAGASDAPDWVQTLFSGSGSDAPAPATTG